MRCIAIVLWAGILATAFARDSSAEIIEIHGTHECPISHHWDGWECTYGPWSDGTFGDEPPVDPGSGGGGGVGGGEDDSGDDEPGDDPCAECGNVLGNCLAAADMQATACEMHGLQTANVRCNLNQGPPGQESIHATAIGGRTIRDLLWGNTTIPGFDRDRFEYQCLNEQIGGREETICYYDDPDACVATYRQDIPGLSSHLHHSFQAELNVNGVGLQGGVKRGYEVTYGGRFGYASQCAAMQQTMSQTCHERSFQCTSENNCFSVVL